MFNFELTIIHKEIFAVFVVGFANFLVGYAFSYVSYMNPSANESNTLIEATAGSLSVFTAIFGTFFFGYIADKYGRKKSLLLVFVNYCIGGAIYFIFKTNMALYISRALIGVSNGARPISILYVSEISQKTRRGTFVSSLGMFGIFGIFCTYLSQFYLVIQTVSGLTSLMAIFGFIGMCFLPETKYWHLMQHNREKARESILWFNSSALTKDMENELNEIQVSKNIEKHTNVFQVLSDPVHFKNFLIVTILFICRTGCGREPLGVYSADYFHHLHLIYDPKILTLIQGFCEFIVSICCTSIVGKFERRTLLFASIFILIPSLFILIITHIFIDFFNEHIPWLTPVFATVYASGCVALLFPLVTLVSVEVVSSSNEYRNKIYNISYSIMNLSRGIFSASFPFLLDSFDINIILLIFLISNLLLLILIKFFVIETANKAFHACVPEKNVKNEENIELP